MGTRTAHVKEAGQSLWLDNIQRKELQDGTLKRMIVEDGICGVTSNPTIFMNAVSKSTDYDEQIMRLTNEGKSSGEIYHHITIEDIRTAGELFLPVYEETGHKDGFVSIEVNPQHAFNVEESILEARDVVTEIGLPNIMVKIPGTREGLAVVRQLIIEGFNVNVTLLFDPERYRQVAETYIQALEERSRQGNDISDVHSVASFFISRVDANVDRILDESGKENAAALRGEAAIQVAKVTYAIYQDLFFGERFSALREKGARIQRVLWASTGTKDPSYSDVKYVDGLIGPQTINTLPPKTLAALRDHGVVKQTIDIGLKDAPEILRNIEACGVDFAALYSRLEDEGVKAFEKSYLDLLQSVEEKGKSLCAKAAN